MGRVVDKRDKLPLRELLLLLQSGYSVSHQGDEFVTMFPPTMKKHQAALAWSSCSGGRFVVRETAKSA